VGCVLALVGPSLGGEALARNPRAPGSRVNYLQERFGLGDRQARGALGALLVFARQSLTQSDFDELAQRIPNAEHIMQAVKQQGVVSGPLDDLDDYEKTLSNVGIGQPLASRIAPAVLEYLGAAGYDRERDILARVLHG
jgi:hypothetical protein